MRKHMSSGEKLKRSFYLVNVFLCIFSLFMLGCSKEKTTELEVQGPVGTCDVIDGMPQDVKKPLEVNFGNRIKLIGVTVDKQAEDKLQVSYYWEIMDLLEAYNTVFVHFNDKNNKIVFQNDHTFCPQKSFAELKKSIVKETFEVFYPKTAVGQEITLKIGLYDIKFGGRLNVDSAKGTALDDNNTSALIDRIMF